MFLGFMSCWINKALDHFKTQEMCNKEVEKDPWSLVYVPNHLKTQEMCNKAVEKDPLLLIEVPDHLKAQKMYNEVVKKN